MKREEEGRRKKFVPLEANPDVLTRFAGKLGLNTKNLRFCDVFGLDEVISRHVQPACPNFEFEFCKIGSYLP